MNFLKIVAVINIACFGFAIECAGHNGGPHPKGVIKFLDKDHKNIKKTFENGAPKVFSFIELKQNLNDNEKPREIESKFLDIKLSKVNGTDRKLHEYNEGHVEVINTKLYEFKFPGTDIILRRRFPSWVEEVNNFNIQYNSKEKQLYCWSNSSTVKSLVYSNNPSLKISNIECYIPEQVFFILTDDNRVVEVRLPTRSYEPYKKNDFFGVEGGWSKLNDKYFFAQLYVNRPHSEGWNQVLERRIYIYDFKKKNLNEIDLSLIKLKYPNYKWDFLSEVTYEGKSRLSLILKNTDHPPKNSIEILLSL